MTLWVPSGTDAPPAPAIDRVSAAALAARLANLARGAVTRALDLVYPPSCLACRGATQAAGALCSACWSKVAFIERPFCERLGTPFARDLGEGLISPEAMANPPVWDRARAVAAYDEGSARALVHRLKYYDRMDVAGPMGRWMARAGLELIEQADLLVPVPLHRARLAARRFNQAMALARVVSRETGAPVDGGALERIKPMPPQVGLSRAGRASNMQGAFRVSPEAAPRIAGRRVLLVDDVLTSGATTNAAARALRRAGAAAVDVLVFARVVTAS